MDSRDYQTDPEAIDDLGFAGNAVEYQGRPPNVVRVAAQLPGDFGRYTSSEALNQLLVAEPTVNAVISKRFAKRQQMQWTPRGAHPLLQTRTRTLDGTLRRLFERWYPGLANDNVAKTAQQAA